MQLKSIIAAIALAATGSSFAATPLSFDADGTAGFTNVPAAGSFTDDYSFTVPDAFDMTAGSVTTKINGPKDIDFSAVYITDGTNVYNFVQTGFDGNPSGEQWTLLGATLNSGTPYDLILKGTQSANKARYSGELSVVAVVPEPETYALMLAGLSLMGFIARRRRGPASRR